MSEAEPTKSRIALSFIAVYYIHSFFGTIRETLYYVDVKLWLVLLHPGTARLTLACVGVVIGVGLLLEWKWAKIVAMALSGVFFISILAGFVVARIDFAKSEFGLPPWNLFGWLSVLIESTINGAIVWFLAGSFWHDARAMKLNDHSPRTGVNGSVSESKSARPVFTETFVAAYYLSNFSGTTHAALFLAGRQFSLRSFDATEIAALILVTLGVVAGVGILLRKDWSTAAAVAVSGTMVVWTMANAATAHSHLYQLYFRMDYAWMLDLPREQGWTTMLASALINVAIICYFTQSWWLRRNAVPGGA
jgi:hypothetical protein